jgi:regulator of protease activity HflC (stomatin/prohibitin superfamily)
MGDGEKQNDDEKVAAVERIEQAIGAGRKKRSKDPDTPPARPSSFGDRPAGGSGDSFFARRPYAVLGVAFLLSIVLFMGGGAIMPALSIPLILVGFVIMAYFAYMNPPGAKTFPYDADRRKVRLISAILGTVGIFVLLMLLSESLIIVPAGHKGVLVTTPNGNNFEEINEGWSFSPYYILCSKELIRYNTQQEAFVGSDESADNAGSIMVSSQDNVGIYVDFSIVYHIEPSKVADLRIEAGDYKQSVLIPVARSVPRDICAQFNALDIRGERRSVVEQGIRENITIKLAEKYIIVELFALRDIRLPAQYENAIVAKKVAEQNVITQQYNLQAQQFVANQTIINAQASADAVVINATAQANATVVLAKGRAEAIELIMAKLNSTPGNASADYLRYLYISALNDPNSNIQFIMVPTEGGTPIIVQVPPQQ